MSGARAAAAGFTLMEVLVALIIVAFGMGAVLTALTSAADTEIRLREKTYAEWVGLNQLATERLRTSVPTTGTQEGDASFAGSSWHWQETVENMDIPGLRRITIRVRQSTTGATVSTASTPASKDVSWLATVMGFRGDAIFTPQTLLPNWDGSNSSAQPPNGPTNTPQLPGGGANQPQPQPPADATPPQQQPGN